MNKAQLVEAVATRIGDRRAAAAAVDGVLDAIISTVGAGESVALTGFGVFEGRARAARTARNPRTGATVAVPATTVPAFRPGATFRAAVSGAVSAAASTTVPVVVLPPEAPVADGAAPVRRSAAFASDAAPVTAVAVAEKPAKKAKEAKAKRAAAADAESRRKPKKRKKAK